MSKFKLVKLQSSAVSVLTLFMLLVSATCAYADSFTIKTGETTSVPRLLDGAGEKGVIEKGGALTIAGDAITSTADFVKVENRGSISTIGDNAEGIFLDNVVNNIVDNHGYISTIGGASEGIYAMSGSNNIINNYGYISTMGAHAYGVNLNGSINSTFNNYGSISTMGSNSRGIKLFGTGTIVNNYGGIFATGDSTEAIIGSVSPEVLNIFPGSQIIGIIDLSDGVDTVNIYPKGAGSSSTLAFTDTETVILHGNNMVNVGGLPGIFATVDPTGQSVNGAVLGTMTGGLHNVITQRNGKGQAGSGQLASTRVEPGMMTSSNGSQIWVSGFGSHRERDDDGQVLAYDHDYYGGVMGYETTRDRSRLGFLAGYAQSDVATDFKSINTDSDSYFIGVYGQEKIGSFNLDASMLAGYEQHDNDRLVVDNLNGFETAEADYSSFFLSPSVTLSAEHMIFDNIALRPSVTGTYAFAWYDSYDESGTTQSNLSIDDRTSHALIAKLQMVAAYIFANGNEVGLLAGGRFRYTANDDIDATLAGTNFSFAAAGDDTHFEALVGAHARVSVMDNLNLTINGQYALSDGIETTASGQAGLEFIF
ncbi:MAG: autotransporter domain-containing protein [Nitrospinales bacterium]